MIHEEHTLWMGEKTRLFAQRWVPDGRPHAVLALVHGFGEHTGRKGADLAGRLSGKVTLKTWDGLYHELHNEPEREAVMEYMLSWVRRISA